MSSDEFGKQLKARGWSYDPASGEFRSRARRHEWEELIGVIPGLKFDDLMAYEQRKHDEWRRALAQQHSA